MKITNLVNEALIGSLRERWLWDNSVDTYFRKCRKNINEFLTTISLVDVPIEKIMRGGEGGLPAAVYARLTNNLLRPYTSIRCGPHVQFLKKYVEVGDTICHPTTFQKTVYYQNAAECITVTGHYFGITDKEQLVKVARRFVALFENGSVHSESTAFHSPPGEPVRVKSINFTDKYEIIDGNHRLAIAMTNGRSTYPVLIEGDSYLSSLQVFSLGPVMEKTLPRLHKVVQ